MTSQGRASLQQRYPPPLRLGLASRSHWLGLPLLLKGERPLEHREGRGPGLVLSAPGLHRLHGHELGPGEERLLRLRGLVVVAIAVDVGMVPVAQDEFHRRPDAGGVMAVGPVPVDRGRRMPVAVDCDDLRLDLHDLPAFVHEVPPRRWPRRPWPGQRPLQPTRPRPRSR